MPNPTITTNYAGVTTKDVLQTLVLGNEAFEQQSFMVHEDIDDKGLELALLNVDSNIIQAYSSMPSTPSNASSFTNRTLVPTKLQIYDHINPMAFQAYWKEFQKEGPLADKVLNPQIQAALVGAYAKRAANQLGALIWQGDTSLTTYLKWIDGIVTKAVAASVTGPTPAGNLTSSNVIATLEAMEALIPTTLFADSNMVFHMSTRDFRYYQTAVRALTYKGQGPAEAVPALFNGRKIKHYSGFPNNYILAAKASASIDSSLHAGVNASNDPENIQIEKWRPEGDIYFLKATFSLAVNFPFASEMVLYKPA